MAAPTQQHTGSTLRAAAAQAITHALTTGGLRHPKRPEGPLIFPGLQTQSHHDPMIVDAINQTASHLGEAIIDTVLHAINAELIGKTELGELIHTAANTPAQLVTLTCKHGQLLQIAVKPGTNTAQINCRRLRTHLAECEH